MRKSRAKRVRERVSDLLGDDGWYHRCKWLICAAIGAPWNECRAELREMPARYDEQLADLQHDFEALQVAFLFQFHEQTQRAPDLLRN
jgi:hypothetical protein